MIYIINMRRNKIHIKISKHWQNKYIFIDIYRKKLNIFNLINVVKTWILNAPKKIVFINFKYFSTAIVTIYQKAGIKFWPNKSNFIDN